MCGVTSKGFPRLTANTFESSLTSDEVLVHFFNNFLSLPCFPDSVMYNQSSGLFEVVSGAAAVVSGRIRSALLLHKSRLLSDDHTAWSTSPKVDNQYTVHCLDKEEGIQWIKRERLPFFFKSDCYQEYRLSKYLLQWDSNFYLYGGKWASNRDTCSAPLICSSQTDQNTQQAEKRGDQKGLRKSSGQMSDSSEQQMEYLAAKLVKKVLEDAENLMNGVSWGTTSGNWANSPSVDKSFEGNICQCSGDNDKERLQEEKEKVHDGKRGSEGEEQAEWDWNNREVESGHTHQEKLLDICHHGVCCQVSGPGLNDFCKFLRGTAGEKLINLWMDIERLKATKDEERKDRYLAMMRTWYQMSSSPTCLNMELLARLGLTIAPCWTEEKLQSIQSCLTDSLFHYWVPRFLTSQCVRGSLPDSSVGLHTNCCHMSHSSTPSCHGSTTPPLLHTNTCWSQTSRSFHTQGGTPQVHFNKLQFIKDEELLCRAEKMLEALCVESRSGFYFTHFCEESGNQLWVNAVYFWTDLQHYHHLFFRDGRDPYRVQREAQLLYFTYICTSAKRNIGVDEEVREEVYDQLRPAFDELFDGVEEHVLEILLEPWILLVSKNNKSYQQIYMQEEVRHLDSGEFRELQSLSEELEQQLKQMGQSSSSSVTPSSPSKTHILSQAWSKVSPEYQGYRLGSLLRWNDEIEHFMSFLQNKDACIHLRCWLDLEEYKRTPQRDDELRQKRSRHIAAKYLNTKYFFGPDSPATAEQQRNILRMAGGWGGVQYDCLSNQTVVEIRDIIRTHIEKTWLPLFLFTAEFTERQKHKKEDPQTADSRSHSRRRRARRDGGKGEGLWMNSSKEIMQFRRVLLNPVTCELFQHFVSLQGDFLENDVLFWQEVQRYKDICHSHSDEATIQQKISVIISCFINSSVPPALQIDIPPEQAQDILDNRATLGPYVFREAQMSVFRELLKYWPEFEEFIRSVEEDQILPLLLEKRKKYRARVRRQRRKEEEEDAKWRAQEALKGQDSFLGEEEETDSDETEEEQDRGGERKESRKLSKLSWSYSKYMAGLKKEEMMLRKQSQTFSDSSCSIQSLQRCSRSTAGRSRRGKRPVSCSTSLTKTVEED